MGEKSLNFKPDRNARVNQSMNGLLPLQSNQGSLTTLPIHANNNNNLNQSFNLSLIDDSKKLVRNGPNLGYNDILDKPYMYNHPARLQNQGRQGSNPAALQNLVLIDKTKQSPYFSSSNQPTGLGMNRLKNMMDNAGTM